MAEIQYIKHLYEEGGKSLREIARITGSDFRTVQKYAYQEDWSREHLPSVEPSGYRVLGPYIETINKWLLEDTREPRKQRHTMMQIWKRLVKEEGFEGCYSCVKRYVRKKRFLMKQATDGFLPLAAPEGHAQIDFGDFKYYDAAGIPCEGHALVMTFPYSNSGWMQVFPSENQECLLEGMKRIFKHIGGVPKRVRADNMTTAVAHVLEGAERILADGFARFMLHYRFTAEFCNPNSGHEKGNVENKVGYDRRNMLVPVPTIEDFESFNEELLSRCDDDHIRPHYKHGALISELWKTEKEHLLSLPEYEYAVYRYEALAVNKYGFVTIDTNKYGLSPELSGKIAQAKIFFDRVELYYDHQLLKTYGRSYGRNGEITDWKQYLPTLVSKPGAAPHTRFFEQMPRLWKEHLIATQGKERKTALMVLMEIVRDGNEAMCDEVLSLAAECGRTDADSIRQCYYMISKAESHPEPLSFAVTTPSLAYNPNLSVYDVLTGGGLD